MSWMKRPCRKAMCSKTTTHPTGLCLEHLKRKLPSMVRDPKDGD